jgi:hypothetical protein
MMRSAAIEWAKSNLFDTKGWGPFCDLTLTLRQGRRSDQGTWVKIADYACRRAFQHFVNLLNRAVYGSAFRRYGKRLRVLAVLEKGEVRVRTLRSWEHGASGRWHVHCAVELPSHVDAIVLEKLIRKCWAKVEWGYGRILVRDGADSRWIDYMLKPFQKSEFEDFLTA